MAVAICLENFRQDRTRAEEFFSKLTFEQWLEICFCPHSSIDLQNWALTMMEKTIESVGQLMNVYCQDEEHGAFENETLDRIWETAKTFEDWYNLYQIFHWDEEQQEPALRKMAETASTKEEWITVLEECPGYEDLEKKAVEALFAQAQSLDDWLEIHKVLGIGRWRYGKEIIFQKVQELAQTLDDWLKIAKSDCFPYDLKEIPFQKLGTLAKTFEDWQKVAECSVETPIHAKALEEMAKFVDELNIPV